MSRSATLPPIRVAPETKASVEAVLRGGESLTQFIESAVRREVEFRAEQNAAIARAKKALHSADKGAGLLTAEEFLAGMAGASSCSRCAAPMSCCWPRETRTDTTSADAAAS